MESEEEDKKGRGRRVLERKYRQSELGALEITITSVNSHYLLVYSLQNLISSHW